MKKILIIQDTPANKISYYHLLLFLICLPFDRFYSELILISFSIHTLLHLKHFSITTLPLGRMLLIQSIFLLTLISALYSYNVDEGFSKVGRQLALVLFPILFALTKLNLDKYKHRFFMAFAITCTLTVAYLYFDALRTILYTNLPLSALFTAAFINHNFTQPIELHATYLSMYACFSLLYLIYRTLHSTSPIHKAIYLACCTLLTLSLIQLASKSVLIAAIVSANFIIPYIIQRQKQRLLYLSVSVISSIIVIIGIIAAPVLKNRYVGGFKEDLAVNKLIPSIPEPRITRWKSAFQLINQSPFIGYGSGAEIPVLKEQYFKDKLYISYYNELNAHNQYISIALTSGFMGLFLFLFIVFICCRIAYKTRDVLFLGFLSILVITSISENILDLNKGIFFTAFFLSLFLLTSNNTSSQISAMSRQRPQYP